MVVGQDHRSRLTRQGFNHHLTGIHRGLRQRAAKHLHGLQHAVLRIEKHHREDLMGAICQQQLQVVTHSIWRVQAVAFAHLAVQQIQRLLHNRRTSVSSEALHIQNSKSKKAPALQRRGHGKGKGEGKGEGRGQGSQGGQDGGRHAVIGPPPCDKPAR